MNIGETLRPALFIAAILGLLGATFLHADGQTITLTGRLSGTEDARESGIFYLDADELGVITINVGQVSYLGDYLDGYRNRRVLLTIGPEAAR